MVGVIVSGGLENYHNEISWGGGVSDLIILQCFAMFIVVSEQTSSYCHQNQAPSFLGKTWMICSLSQAVLY